MTTVNLSSDNSKQEFFTELFVELNAPGIKDVVIIQDDVIVANWHTEGKDRVNYIFSCTKSFLSALIGIAIDQHYISSIDQPIIEYFPELPQLNEDRRFQQITIQHLLTMTSGIDWPPMDRSNKMYNEMVRSDNWLEFVLRRPLADEPGTRFNYTDGGSHLLSAIINRTANVSALEYAFSHLFPYLEISQAKWRENHGVSLGGTGLHMRTIDMAKLGYLYLNDGRLGSVQVIAPDWIQASTQSHTSGHPEWFGSYGYHWWISSIEHNGYADLFFALGAHGQYIFVIPTKNAVVAFRKKPGRKQDVMIPKEILFESVLPCI